MRINFNDNSFLEFNLTSSGKIAIILGARDTNNLLNTVINSTEITTQELLELIKSLNITNFKI